MGFGDDEAVRTENDVIVDALEPSTGGTEPLDELDKDDADTMNALAADEMIPGDVQLPMSSFETGQEHTPMESSPLNASADDSDIAEVAQSSPETS